MGLPLPSVSAYERMFRDAARHELPPGSVWDMIDILPDFDAPGRARGAWAQYVNTGNNGAAVAYASNVNLLSPKLYWRLGEAPGASIAQDSSGNGNTGAIAGGVVLGQPGAPINDSNTAALISETSSTPVNPPLHGANPNSYILASYVPYVAGSSRTFMGWAIRTTNDLQNALFGSNDFNGQSPMLTCAAGSNDVTWSPDGGFHTVTWVGAWPGLNQFVFWVLTYNDTTKVAELFINGVSKGQLTVASGYAVSGLPFIAGLWSKRGISGGSQWFAWNGVLDEIAVFESILTPSNIASVQAAVANPPLGIGWADFNGSPAHLVIAGDKSAIKIDANRGVTSVGSITSSGTCSKMVAHRDKLIFASQKGDEPIQIWDGTNPVGPVTNSPSNVVDVCLYEDFSVAVGGDTMYFSNAGDASTWSPSSSFIKMPDDAIAVASLRNVIVYFGESSIWRVRGSVPPGNGPSNMIVENLAPSMQGTIDSRSVAFYANSLIFANDQGVWQTDGNSLKNLTEKFGVQQYWKELVEKLNAGNSKFAVAWQHRGYYFITIGYFFVTGGITHRVYLDTLVFDLDRSACYRMSNMGFLGAANALIGGIDDCSLLYQNPGDNTGRIGTISQIFDPTTSGVDGNGVVIQPSIETGYLRGFMRLHRKWILSPGIQTWRNVYLSYDLTGGGRLAISFSSSDETDAEGNVVYNPLPNYSGSMGPTTNRTRVRIPIQVSSNGVAFKLQLLSSGNQWTSFRIWEIETEFYPRETSRV